MQALPRYDCYKRPGLYIAKLQRQVSNLVKHMHENEERSRNQIAILQDRLDLLERRVDSILDPNATQNESQDAPTLENLERSIELVEQKVEDLAHVIEK